MTFHGESACGGRRPGETGRVSVIVPVYNESASITQLFGAICRSPVAKEIVFVDDGSSDGTRHRLQALTGPVDVTVVFHDRNYGKGAAIRTGLQYARGEYVLIQDADLEYDPQDYVRLLAPLQDGTANVVYGVRPDRPERGLLYYLGAKFLTRLTNLLFGSHIRDEATCYKAFRRSVLTRIPLECQRFEFCSEVTAKVLRLGEVIHEVPVSYRPRTRKEGKKLRLTDGWGALWTLVRFRCASRQRLLSGPRRSAHTCDVTFVHSTLASREI